MRGRGGDVFYSLRGKGGRLRTEIPTPLTPRSPRPRMRDPSVTTQIEGFGYGQFLRMVVMDLRCLMEIYNASGRVYRVEYWRQTSPMVGV